MALSLARWMPDLGLTGFKGKGFARFKDELSCRFECSGAAGIILSSSRTLLVFIIPHLVMDLGFRVEGLGSLNWSWSAAISSSTCHFRVSGSPQNQQPGLPGTVS